jgi:hypothetical protein
MNNDDKVPGVGHWIDSLATSFFLAVVPTAALAATNRDLWTLAVTFASVFAAAVVQHRRQIPQKQWTEEQRETHRDNLEQKAAEQRKPD